ncbi:hypothetical protein EPUL_005989 [Erysiphe pulchra]|uniref:BZIP domain-containing protein n=1 Tax=Erysiphe pulchra TaxID=225359 RepID=A0A2S4PMY8_9PEZI|nr:hypothetical protein EPUL_005989 [Erysiphe pulchra]
MNLSCKLKLKSEPKLELELELELDDREGLSSFIPTFQNSNRRTVTGWYWPPPAKFDAITSNGSWDTSLFDPGAQISDLTAMENIDSSFCDSFKTHPSLGSFQKFLSNMNIWNNMDINWPNSIASDDEEFFQARTENYRHGLSQTEMAGVSRQSSSTPDQSYVEKFNEVPKSRKRLSNSFSDVTVVKRRRGPNKNQKILTEEERKKKKAKALCRNAQSARTCRGKRKQLEEKLKSRSMNIEKDFHLLFRTRELLGQELFDLLEHARVINDPHIIEAVEKASIRLSTSMTHSQSMQELLDTRTQQTPIESMFASRMNSNISMQNMPKEAYLPAAIIQMNHELEARNISMDCYNSQTEESETNLNKSHLQLDLSKPEKVLAMKNSPIQNDSGANTLATPVSIRGMSYAQEDDATLIQNQPPDSPNFFMGDTITQEEFENVDLVGLVSEKRLSFMGNQFNSEQEKLDFVYSPSSIPQYNEQPSIPFESHLLMRPSPLSLDTQTFNQQTFDLSFSPSLICQTPLGLPSEGCASSDLETAIAQLIKFT